MSRSLFGSLSGFRLLAFSVICLLALALPGCQVLLAEAATNFSLELTPETLRVAPGSSGDIAVEIRRTVPVDVIPLPITLELYNPPAGVSAEGLEFPSSVSEDTLRVSVAAGTPAGEHTLRLRATNGVKTREATVALTIAAP